MIVTGRRQMNMNYGKRGVRQKQRALNSLWTKLGKMFFLAIVKAFLVALVCVGTIGICAACTLTLHKAANITAVIISTLILLNFIDGTPSQSIYLRQIFIRLQKSLQCRHQLIRFTPAYLVCLTHNERIMADMSKRKR